MGQFLIEWLLETGYICSTIMDEKFKRHVMETYSISDRNVDRLYEEFLEHFDASVEDFVRHRHFELKNQGRRNDEIYPAIVAEAERLRFPAEGLTERKVRRIIYG
jgi:hypothetical protein